MMHYKISAQYDCHPGARLYQQDACLISDLTRLSDQGVLAVLSDGMGGMEAGERFSRIAVDEMVRYFSSRHAPADMTSRLLNAYHSAREKALALRAQENVDGGATVVAVLIQDGYCAFLSVGDSRIYLLRAGGLIQLNREQTLGLLLDEQAAFGHILPEEAQHNIHRAALTHHLAEKTARAPDLSPMPFALCPGDKLVLMSDGAYGSLTQQELTALAALPDVSGTSAIIEAVLAKQLPRQDNLSVLMLAIST